jgi:hypothetical protein
VEMQSTHSRFPEIARSSHNSLAIRRRVAAMQSVAERYSGALSKTTRPHCEHCVATSWASAPQ